MTPELVTVVTNILTTSGPMVLIVIGGLWWFAAKLWPGMMGEFKESREAFTSALEKQQTKFEEMLEKQREHCIEHRREVDEILARRGGGQ